MPEGSREDGRVRKLLEEYPLYRATDYRTLGEVSLPAEIEMFCSSQKCNKPQIHELQQDGTLDYARYKCRNCRSAIHRFLLQWDRYHESEEHGGGPMGPTVFHYEVGTVAKAGQSPPIAEQLPPGLQARLGQTRSKYYQTAIRLRNFGLGIGSLAYLRRVVEEMANNLLEIIVEEAQLENSGTIDQERLKVVRESRVFDDKMEFAKAALPPRLTPGGHNPIDRLHDLASAGLHGESEEECIKTFDAVRSVFEFFFSELPERLTKEREFRKQLSDLGKPASG
jgi:hypothetical protein